jgi:hypothetical protein
MSPAGLDQRVPHARRAMRIVAVAMLSALVLDAREAAADRYEATVSVRPIAGIGRFTEDVTGGAGGASASTSGGGGELGLAYGVRNWLDVSGELAAVGFTAARYDMAKVSVMGVPETGRVTRTSRLAQLRAGASLRLGLAWVPTLYVGAGLSARMPTAAALRTDVRGDTVELTPDGMSAKVQLDACFVARIGIDRRIDRRWSIGAAMEASHTLGLGASTFDLVSAGISIAYTWYPQAW